MWQPGKGWYRADGLIVRPLQWRSHGEAGVMFMLHPVVTIRHLDPALIARHIQHLLSTLHNFVAWSRLWHLHSTSLSAACAPPLLPPPALMISIHHSRRQAAATNLGENVLTRKFYGSNIGAKSFNSGRVRCSVSLPQLTQNCSVTLLIRGAALELILLQIAAGSIPPAHLGRVWPAACRAAAVWAVYI